MAITKKTTERRKRPRAAWLTVQQIAGRYQFHESTVILWIKRGKLAAKRVGGHYRIRRRDWIAFRDAGFTPAPSSGELSPLKAERLRKARVEKAKAELRAKGVG